MKQITFLATLLFATVALAGQGQMPPVPAEFAKVAFMAGRWTGTMKMYGMGPNPTNARTTVIGRKTMDNRYIQSNHVMDMGKMGKMEGMHLISYHPFKKTYVAFWFDSSAPGVMEMSGNFTGNTLTLVSKPTEIPGMPAPMTMRAVYVKHSNSRYDFRLESKQGEKWAPMITGQYRKVG